MRPASAAAGLRGWAVPARLAALERFEPWVVLVPLVAAQWVALAIFAAVVRHNGWLFYQGGDETFLYSSGWIVGHGHLPDTAVGFLWPIVTAPIALLAGPNFLSGLPVLILLQVLVLLPLGLLAIYGCGVRIASLRVQLLAGNGGSAEVGLIAAGALATG